jgi:ATP-binding cassette subfamily C (CFTR/MRP) protein 1
MKLHITRAVIAHRINTVVQCDQVMVMDAGSVNEIGAPASLLSHNEGSFRSLVLDTGAASYKKLSSIASSGRVMAEEHDDIEMDFDCLKVEM